MSSIDLPSIKVVDAGAFESCLDLTNVKFGKDLESIRAGAFKGCPSLERIALPLKNGMITKNSVFQGCVELRHIDLVGGVHETSAALLMEEWKNDMNEEIDTISQLLTRTYSGNDKKRGGKAKAIRRWIRTVLDKIIRYTEEHRRCVNEAGAILQPSFQYDILFKNVLPFLNLPGDTFDRLELLAREERAEETTATRVLRINLGGGLGR